LQDEVALQRADITKATPPTRLFLCYARADLAQVEALYDRLSASGLAPWMDTRNIYGGEDWQRSIWRAIREAHFFIFCVSRNSQEKRGFLQREIRRALEIWEEKLEDDIYLIPLRLDDCVLPASVERFQRVDLFAPDGFPRLLSAISVGIERQKTVLTESPTSLQTTRKEVREDSEEQRYSLSASYPQLSLIASASDHSINTAVASFINTICEQWRSESIATAKIKREMREQFKSAAWDDLSISYGVTMNTRNLFSVQFSISTYGAGAAHPNSVTRTLNFRRDSGAQLGLTEIFRPASDYLNTLSTYCIADLEQQVHKGSGPSGEAESHNSWIATGAGPSYQNFERFVLEPGGLRIFFDPYQVDCYAAGRYEVYIPVASLMHVFDPELATLLMR
jgi:hypothetical protein